MLRVRRWAGPVAALSIAATVALQASDSMAYRLSIVPIFAIVALSLNSLMAGTGQVSLGHAALMGLGAFMSAVAASTWQLPFPVAVGIGVVSAAGAALVLGVAALRVQGLHLAVLTMGFAIVLESFVFPMEFFARGGAGILLERPSIGGLDLADERTFLLVTVAVLAAVWWLDRRLFGSPIGRTWVALRDNEIAASARGIRGTRARVAAFMISGACAGLAGALFGYRQGLLAATQFPLLMSITFLLYVVIGGLGVRVGVVAVTGFFAYSTTSTSGPSSGGEIILIGGSIAVLLIVGRMPGGIGGSVRSLCRRWWPERTQAVPHLADDVAIAAPQEATDLEVETRVIELVSARRRPLLEIRGLTLRFDGILALRDVDLDVAEAEIVAIVGPNGAGKTTLFNTISGYAVPDGGVIRFEGRPITDLGPVARARAGIGRTFQHGGLWESETVETNLLIAQHVSLSTSSVASMLAVGPRESWAERNRRVIAHEVLSILGMADCAHQQVATLAYGRRRVLELGCALMTGPKLLTLDEPGAGLTTDECEWLAEVVASIRADLGISVLVIEHHMPFVRRVADTVCVLDMGAVLVQGPPDEVMKDPRVLGAYLGSGALASTAPVGLSS